MKRAAAGLSLLLAAVLGAGCSNYTGDASQRVAEWANGAAWDSNNSAIVMDLGYLANGLRERKLLPLRTACAAFIDDAANLYNQLPTPDTTLTDELNRVLGGFDTAANQCYSAGSFSSAEFAKYQRTLKRATATYHQAQERLAGFGVH